jgi:hypothetical protein
MLAFKAIKLTAPNGGESMIDLICTVGLFSEITQKPSYKSVTKRSAEPRALWFLGTSK